jgi:hypothetical protein
VVVSYEKNVFFDERAEAMELLRDPRLLERIVEDFARCGVVGEETNKLVGYLGVVSRHLEAPLAVIVQSSSAAGKSSLMEAVLAFVPEEQRVQYSAMTGQSLFYMGETDLKHKVLAIVEEAGAHSAAYALKLLQSEGVLTIASTGKDPATGRLLTHQYRVEGPVMIFLTTTAINLDEEMLNRCLVLSVNEDREQTQAIHRVRATGDRRNVPYLNSGCDVLRRVSLLGAKRQFTLTRVLIGESGAPALLCCQGSLRFLLQFSDKFCRTQRSSGVSAMADCRQLSLRFSGCEIGTPGACRPVMLPWFDVEKAVRAGLA